MLIREPVEESSNCVTKTEIERADSMFDFMVGNEMWVIDWAALGEVLVVFEYKGCHYSRLDEALSTVREIVGEKEGIKSRDGE